MKTTIGTSLLRSLLVLCGPSLLAADTGPAFPLKVSDNRRHLVDQKGTPFLYQADTPWMLFTKLSETEAKEYIMRRKAQGFTALQVMLTGFLGMTNRAGELPFAGTPPEQDFAQPNEKFFAHVDRVVREAQQQDMLLAMAPLWSGCCGEGWAGKEKDGSPKPLNQNGVEKSRALGRWLGERYGKFNHVMWILGGDIDPDNARAEIRALGLGLKDTAPEQLITYHASSSHSSTDVWPAEEPWLDVSMVYTYFRGFNKAWNRNQPDVYEVSHAEFAKIPVRPFFLGESTYEGEHGAWGSAVQARKQAYWCVLGGGCGHAYGSPNWNFPKNWRDVLEQPGGLSLKHLRSLLESRPWWKLLPDTRNILAVEGRGAFATNDYAVTALADDGSFALSYLPTRRTLTIDLTRLSGERVVASWFNPRTGEATRLDEFTDKSRHAFDPPSNGDWVLVLDDAAKGYPPPGSVRSASASPSTPDPTHAVSPVRNASATPARDPEFTLRTFAAPWSSPFRVDPQWPHQLVNREGQHLLILNKTAWAYFGCQDPGGYLERARSQGVNVIRVALEGRPYWHELNLDLWPWGGTRAQPDWSRFNESYWQRVEERVRLAGEKGIGLDVVLYMELHPDANDTAAQRPYWEQVLRRLGRYANVLTWEIANEYTGNEVFQDAVGRFFQEQDPQHRPVCTSDGTTDDAVWPAKSWMDLAINHTCTSSTPRHDLDDWYLAVARNTRAHGKPAWCNESGRERRHQNDDGVHRRKQGWLWYAAGCHWTWHSWDGCEGIDDRAYRAPGEEFLRPMVETFQALPFWRMNPSQTAAVLSDAGLVQAALATSERDCLFVYGCTRETGKTVSGTELKVRLPNGTYRISVLQPADGATVEEHLHVAKGMGQPESFELPRFTDDVALRIERTDSQPRTAVP